jgi:serine/threonine protein kinase
MQEHNSQFFPAIFDADLESDHPYIVMEYFESGCLSEGVVKSWSLEDKVRFYLYLILAVAYQ